MKEQIKLLNFFTKCLKSTSWKDFQVCHGGHSFQLTHFLLSTDDVMGRMNNFLTHFFNSFIQYSVVEIGRHLNI